MGKPARWIRKIFGLKKSSKSPSEENFSYEVTKQDEAIKVTISNDNQHLAKAGAQKHVEKELVSAVEVAQHSIEVKQAPGKIAAAAIVDAFSLIPSTPNAVEFSVKEGSDDRKLAGKEAVNIQTAFQHFPAHRASSAYQGLVKLQALVRGHLVRKQAALALQCILAIVKVQAHIRGCCVRRQESGREAHKILCSGHHSALKLEPQDGRDSPSGTFQLKGRYNKDGNIVLASAFQRQLNIYPSKLSLFNLKLGESVSGWYWLEFWTAAQPWAMLSVSEESTSASHEVRCSLQNGRAKNGLNLRASTGSLATRLCEHTPSPKHIMSSSLSSELSDKILAAESRRTESCAVVEAISGPFSESRSFNRATTLIDETAISEMVRENPVQVQKENQHVRPRKISGVTTPPKSSAINGSMKAVNLEHIEGHIQGSPTAIPSYMAATESAKAKARANSTPRNRPDLPEYSPPVDKRRLSLPGSNGRSNSTITHSQRWNSNVKIKETEFTPTRLPSSLRNSSRE